MGFTNSPPAAFTGVKVRGQLTSTTIPQQGVVTQITRTIFGPGTAGTVTISTSATQADDKLYKNLTLDAGVALRTGGYRVFVSTTFHTGTSTSVLTASGYNASGFTPGAGAPTGTLGGGGAGANAAAGHAPATATYQGGAGGPGSGYVGGAVKSKLAAPPNWTQLYTATMAGGGGGGGSVNASGGGGGGALLLAARVMTGTGIIRAKGGNGSAHTTATYGGGGGGGLALVYNHVSSTWKGRLEVTPGTTATAPAATGHTGTQHHQTKYFGYPVPS